MKRSRFARRGALNRDAEQLARLATGLAASASRIEDSFWESRLAEAVDRQLRTGNEDTLTFALDHLSGANSRASNRLTRNPTPRLTSIAPPSQSTPRDTLPRSVTPCLPA